MFTPPAYFSILLSPSFCTVTSFPDGYFNMGALDRLEKVAGIPIFGKLAPKLLEMVSTLDFHDSIVGNIRNENSPVDGTKAMFKAWLSDESSLPPSWQVLLEILQAIKMGELAQEIEYFFKKTSTTLPSASPVRGMLELAFA